MCGIVGYSPDGGVVSSDAAHLFSRLYLESVVRGLHAFGIATGALVVRSFQATDVTGAFDPSSACVAHARYSTSGDWHSHENNQPIVFGGVALAFNGVISMANKETYEREFGVSCVTANDGEIFVRRLLAGDDPERFISSMSGSFAGVWLRDGRLYAARNARRPMWRSDHHGRWYASTRDIFTRAGFPEPRQVAALELESA